MPRKDFDQMKDPMDRLMGEFFSDARPLGYQPDRAFHPPTDIYETEEDLVVIMEIAGMKTEDIQVFFEKDLLSISGMRTESATAPKTRLHQMEIDYGKFERTLRIPFSLKTDEIRAVYHQGFLTITIPKKKEPALKIVEVL